MTIKKMYRIATKAQREGKECRKSTVINEVNHDEQDDKQETNDTEVAAFRCWANAQGSARPKSRGNTFQGNSGRGYQNQSRGGQQTTTISEE